MKTMLLPLIVIILAAGVHAAGQSVLISPEKKVFARPKPLSENKANFTVTYPKVKARTPALSRKIESAISFEKVLELNVQEEIEEIQWLEEADFEVNYNANGILVVTLSISGSGAYPDAVFRTVAIDLRTGLRITPVQAFRSVNGLVATIRKKQSLEIAESIRELKADPEEKDTDTRELFDGRTFAAKDLREFSVSDKGITFIYDYGFPHVIQALEPEGRYFLTWKEAAPYVNRRGPLARFVAK